MNKYTLDELLEKLKGDTNKLRRDLENILGISYQGLRKIRLSKIGMTPKFSDEQLAKIVGFFSLHDYPIIMDDLLTVEFKTHLFNQIKVKVAA